MVRANLLLGFREGVGDREIGRDGSGIMLVTNRFELLYEGRQAGRGAKVGDGHLSVGMRIGIRLRTGDESSSQVVTCLRGGKFTLPLLTRSLQYDIINAKDNFFLTMRLCSCVKKAAQSSLSSCTAIKTEASNTSFW